MAMKRLCCERVCVCLCVCLCSYDYYCYYHAVQLQSVSMSLSVSLSVHLPLLPSSVPFIQPTFAGYLLIVQQCGQSVVISAACQPRRPIDARWRRCIHRKVLDVRLQNTHDIRRRRKTQQLTHTRARSLNLHLWLMEKIISTKKSTQRNKKIRQQRRLST